MNPEVFREYDIRGIADPRSPSCELTPDFAWRLGLAYSTLVPGGTRVGVGRDCRLSSPDLCASLIRGLREGGLNIVDLGMCPTPLTYFSVHFFGLGGSIMVTGSHNPGQYNGFKIGIGTRTLHGPEIQNLYQVMRNGPPSLEALRSSQPGRITRTEIIPEYMDWLLAHVHMKRRLRVVVDAGSGTAGPVAPRLLERLGCDVIRLFCKPDGRFPFHHPDPTNPENLSVLSYTVKKEGADLGIGYDGDSDRIGIVDEKGRIIFGDDLLALLARDVLKHNPGATIISEVKSSHRLYQDIEQHGGRPLMWKTGHSLIKEKMKSTGALLAGEMSGHIFFSDRYFGYDDAIYASARLIEILSGEDRSLSALLSNLPPSVATPEIRIDCPDNIKFELVERMRAALKNKFGSPEYKFTEIDGVRVDSGEGWGLIRASNTQPVLVMRFEASTQARLDEIRNAFAGTLKLVGQETGNVLHV